MNLSKKLMSPLALAVLLATSALLLVTPHAAHAQAAGNPPDGRYNCSKISGSSLINLGTLVIKSGTYRGLEDSGEFHKFTVDASGNITWSSGLVGFPDGWKITRSKYLGIDKYTHKPLIKIYYTSPRGAAEELDAMQE